jgi:hypothetical protein
MARARFKEGVDFYDKGQYEQARAAFLQAYALKKHPAVLLNLAWSSLKSGHVLEGEHYFKQFLTEGRDITEKQRADANDGLNQAHARLGRVDVVAGAGTEVMVDGDKIGTTPLAEPIAVEPGAHTVKFRAPDGTTDTESVSVLAGEKSVARFTRASPTPAAPPPPPPSPPAATPEAPAAPAATPTAPEETKKSAEEPPKRETTSAGLGQRGLLAPPANMAPVYVGGVLTLAGLGTAIGMLVAKQSAQDKADATAANIQQNGGKHCDPPEPANLVGLADACNSLASDTNDVNTDATIGNIALGVGLVALAGTVVYWLAADKGSKSTGDATQPIVSPLVGRSVAGLSMSGTF